MKAVNLLDGESLYIHDGGDLFSGAIERDKDYYERDILDYVANKYPKQEAILDIGANIGNHALYFSKYLDYSSLICFEPIHDNFVLLNQNMRGVPSVHLRQEAVGEKRQTVRMSINRDNMGACEVNPDGTEVVQMVRVDDLLLKQRVSLMKIDVEWYEPKVLEGAVSIIAEDHPLILIEDSNRSYADILIKLGYILEKGWLDHRTYLYA